MAMSKNEKYLKDLERRKNKYIDKFGSIPLCACGCGKEVSVRSGYKVAKVIKGHTLPNSSFKRSDFVDRVSDIRNTHNFSLKDIGTITGLSKNQLSSILFKDVDRINVETVEKVLAPLVFIDIFLPDFNGDLFPKMSKSEGSRIRWEQPDGMVDFEPIRSEMLKLKDELQTNWSLISNYFDTDHRIITRYFLDPNHKWITKENASKYRKEFGKIRSLSAEAKREKFSKKSTVHKSYESRDRFRIILHSFKKSYSIKTWKEVAEEIGMKPNRLQSLLRDRAKNMRGSVFNEIVNAVNEATHKREMRRNQIIRNMNNTYGIEDISKAA
jgi:transcriptional regulator with XRE-family HTH domain